MLFLVFGLFVLLYSSYVACTPHDNLFLNTQTFPWLCLFCVLCLRRMELLSPPVAILSIHLNTNSSECSSMFHKSERTALSSVFPRHIVLPVSSGHYLSSQLYPVYCPRLCLTLCHETCLLMQCPLRNSSDHMMDQSRIFFPHKPAKRCLVLWCSQKLCRDGYVIKPKRSNTFYFNSVYF